MTRKEFRQELSKIRKERNQAFIKALEKLRKQGMKQPLDNGEVLDAFIQGNQNVGVSESDLSKWADTIMKTRPKDDSDYKITLAEEN